MNLLPQLDKSLIQKGLRTRFFIVTLSMFSAGLIIGLVLLSPTYILSSVRLEEVKAETDTSSLENDETISKILDLPNEVNSKLKILKADNLKIRSVDLLTSVLDIKPAGISIQSISFGRNKQNEAKAQGLVLLVSGVASDRKSLIDYSHKLEDTKKFTSVNVPVSSLTKDKNLPFTMNLFIAN